MTRKTDKKIRGGGGTAGGRKLAQSGGARILGVEHVDVKKPKPVKLKAKAYTTGGGTKRGANVVKGRVKKRG